ncbi:MAG: glycerol-3-phosphate 1-O-acyltransferase PlsY [Pseudomonadota bacterium]
MDNSFIQILVFAAVGYLAGSIPFGLLLTKAAGLGDIRNIGSGNIGATNVLRTGNKGLAALTLLLDAIKGMIPVIIAKQFSLEASLAAGLFAFLGHLYPIWLRFNGGKGVATFAGISLGFSWHVLVPFAVTWILVAIISRYSSLAALVGSAVATIALFYVGQHAIGGLYVLLFALIVWKHRANIERLRAGTEGKIGQKG